jgi:hydrogenase/urease accessory protein HupE
VKRLGGLVILLLAIGVADVRAHDARPVYVEITETSPQRFVLVWKAPPSIPAWNVPEIVLGPASQARAPVITTDGGGAYMRRRLYHAPPGLSGEHVEIRYPVAGVSSPCLIRLRLHSGETHTKLLAPGVSTWQVPEREDAWRVAREYTVLGIRHILEGVDHLLFVLCLLLVAGTGRRMLITITGFTIAHSGTLALAALELVQIPVPPVEAAIALSIVFLAVEIAGGARDRWTYQYPITVSVSFGLLHGFGFAAVLREIGLPQTEVPTALLFFNVGVELGQIAFVAAVVGLLWAVALLLRGRETHPGDWLRRLEKPLAYAVGVLAVYWTTERILSFWS